MSRVLVAVITCALILTTTMSASAQDEEVFSFDTGPEGESPSFLDSLRLDVDIIGRYEASREYRRPEWLFAVGLDIHKVFSDAADAIGDIVGDGGQDKGRITISTRQDGDFVEIRVSDTGGGIPDEIRGNIFDPFFTTKDVGKGTGQGLAISHDVIVNKHGGTIDIEVEPGVGTTFIIRLPIDEQPAIDSRQAA